MPHILIPRESTSSVSINAEQDTLSILAILLLTLGQIGSNESKKLNRPIHEKQLETPPNFLSRSAEWYIVNVKRMGEK